MMAQRLYEAGYITYMRTDSTNLSRDAVEACRATISRDFGARYLPAEPNLYSSKEGAQEAHEAIRPSDVDVHPGRLQGVERDQERLYDLIWRQFVACQMTPAEYLSTNLAREGRRLRAPHAAAGSSSSTVTRAPSRPRSAATRAIRRCPTCRSGERLDLVKLEPLQHFTKPPPRYGEASLVKELEKRGIGRPSTYASIISTIQERGYVRLENRRFYAEKMGDIVTERLVENFGELMDYGFTAGLEEALDEVAVGEAVEEGAGRLLRRLPQAAHRRRAPDEGHAGEPADGDRHRVSALRSPDADPHGAHRRLPRLLGLCAAAEGALQEHDQPDPRRRGGLRRRERRRDEEAGDEVEARLLLKKRHCPICQTAMDSYLVDETRKLHVCGNNPDCPGFEVETGSFQIKGYDGPVLECDKCGEDMQLKTGRFGKYFGCTSDVCKNTRKLLRNGEAAPPKIDPIPMPDLRCERCDDFYLLRDGAAGLFLAASQFPKHRETRAPTVAELIEVQGQARSQIPLPRGRAEGGSRGPARGRSLRAQDAGAVRHLRGGREGDGLASPLPRRALGRGESRRRRRAVGAGPRGGARRRGTAQAGRSAQAGGAQGESPQAGRGQAREVLARLASLRVRGFGAGPGAGRCPGVFARDVLASRCGIHYSARTPRSRPCPICPPRSLALSSNPTESNRVAVESSSSNRIRVRFVGTSVRRKLA